jgi:type IV secretory pathway VirB10-like protein
MWLMVGVAAAMLVIIMLTGHSQPVPRAMSASAAPQLSGLSPDRLRDYQDRLRALDERARVETTADSSKNPPARVRETDTGSRQPDPLDAERKRREYESLFAGNVVLSRRPAGEQPLGERDAALRGTAGTRDVPQTGTPNLDDVADAVVRATTRSAPAAAPSQQPSPSAVSTTPTSNVATPASGRRTPTNTDPISPSAPVQKLLEGTVIDTVLTNRLDGDSASPVNCLVTNPVYSHSGQQVLIPAGSRVLGETKAVRSVGESRLAVAFHRLIFPDGRTMSLDQFTGLNQVGDAALRDQVNQHYWATFGAASAIGVISGLGQYLGTIGFGQGSSDRTIVIAGGFGNATSEATAQVMNRFLNRLPTITIREGHRVKVYLTSDLDLPAYSEATASSVAGARLP